jgi:chromosome segregation ATPase
VEPLAALAAIGTAIGTGVGYAIGGKQGILPGAAALGALGAGIGYVVGKHVADQKEKFACEADYLDAVIASARQVNEETRQSNASFRSEIATLDRDIARLETQQHQKAGKIKALQEQGQRLATTLSQADKQLQKVRIELEIQKQVLAQEQGQSPEYLQKLQTQVTELEHNKTELERHINRLASLKTRVAV